jgi:hypothetical protein
MKTLCMFGITNQHNIHDLKNRRYCTSAVAQVHVHKLPNAPKAPKTPSLYGAGYAKSDFTTCLPAPQRCWGPLGRSEQAVFWGPDFDESVFIAVFHRSQHRPGTPKQAQTWPDGSTYSIVQGTPAFAEIGPIYFGLWCAKNGVLNQFSHSLLIEIPSSDTSTVIVCWPGPA